MIKSVFHKKIWNYTTRIYNACICVKINMFQCNIACRKVHCVQVVKNRTSFVLEYRGTFPWDWALIRSITAIAMLRYVRNLGTYTTIMSIMSIITLAHTLHSSANCTLLRNKGSTKIRAVTHCFIRGLAWIL